MFRATLVCALLLSASSRAGAQDYGWTLSGSATNPLYNVIPPTTDVILIYLWFWCSYPNDGISAARFSLEHPTDATIFSFEPSPGVLNTGTPDDLSLTISECPQGSFLAGQFLVQHTGDGSFSLCLGPATLPPYPNVSYGCADPDQPLQNATMGLVATQYSDEPCAYSPNFFGSCEPAVSVEEFSWGRIKALYRIQ